LKSNIVKLDAQGVFGLYEFNVDSPSGFKWSPVIYSKDSFYDGIGRVKFSGLFKRQLYGLFAYNGNLKFLADGVTYDVTGECWSARRVHLLMLKYKFELLFEGKAVVSVDFVEFTSSQPGDFDSHGFFSNVVNWLKDENMKKRFLSCWE